MIITLNNIDNIEIPSVKNNLERLKALINDLGEINSCNDSDYKICVEEMHTIYDEERVDPCPDYYGYFYISSNGRIIGEMMDIDLLDTIMLFFYDLTFKDKPDEIYNIADQFDFIVKLRNNDRSSS